MLKRLLRHTKSTFMRWYDSASFYLSIHRSQQPPVLIYQFGKVGSTSIYNSLLAHGCQPVFFAHRINPVNIETTRKEHNRTHLPLNHDDLVGIRLYRHVVKPQRRSKIITLVRDPVARNMSAFFQNFTHFTGTPFEKSSLSAESLIEIFLKDYKHDVPLTWFDLEIRSTLGIDVYQHPFPHEQGFQRIQQGNFELLILKLESGDAVLEKEISDFLGLDNFTLTRSNVGNDKNYSSTYQAFKDQIRLPESYIDKMYNSTYARHFYTDAEIDLMRQKWLS